MSWPDGSPVTNATIHCDPLGGDDSVRGELGSADQSGEASCLVFAEQAYRVRLSRLGQNGDPELREAIVSPGQDLARVHFVPGQLDFERHKEATRPDR